MRPRYHRSGVPKGYLSALLSLVAMFCSPAAGKAEEFDRAPVLLRKAILLTPVEAAGTGLAPEVKVKVKIDPAGRVTDVSTLGITPASDFDELFAETTRQVISHWRYAPALNDGTPIATTLEWTVKFQARQAESQFESSGSWLPLATPDPGGAESRRARIVALPLEQRKTLLRRQAEVAEKYLDTALRQRAESPRFVVISDASEPKTAEITAGNLEAVYNIIQGLFGSRITPQPEPYKIVVYMFARRRAFDAMKADLDVLEWSAGFYNPAGLFAFHLEVASMESLFGIMMHEATHAWVDRHLVAPGSYLPRWLGEGFAEYLGNSELRKGQLVPGKTPKAKFVLVMGFGAVRSTPEPRLSLDNVKRKIRSGEGLSVHQLMTADADTFYGEQRSLYYPSAWLLVHFLRHGEASWADQEFPAFMLYVAEGYSAADVLSTVYGASPVEFEERFRTYVRKQF